MTLGSIASRALRYVAIALAVLLSVFLAVVLSNGNEKLPDWLTIGAFTAGLFWITITQSKDYWPRPSFWLTMVGLLGIHLAAFVAILRAYPEWRPIWFAPVILLEGAFLAPILFLLFGRHKRQ